MQNIKEFLFSNKPRKAHLCAYERIMKEVYAFPAEGRLLKSKFTVTICKKWQLNRQSKDTFSIAGFSFEAKCWVYVLTID